MREVYNQVKEQADQFIAKGGIFCMEFERVGDNNNREWFTVDLNVTEKGIEFSFDQNGLPCYFDGVIIGSDNFYLLPFDEYFSDLDHYLQSISENIMDGYLLANNIDAWEI